MTGDLPEMDEPIAFAVDDGAQAGPYAMREIVDSVRMGQRSANTLVWWAGQPDWVPFDSVSGLIDQIELDSQPPPPADDDVSLGSSLGLETDIGADELSTEVETSNPFEGAADYSFADEVAASADEGLADEGLLETSGDSEWIDPELTSEGMADVSLADSPVDTSTGSIGFVEDEDPTPAAGGWGLAHEEAREAVSGSEPDPTGGDEWRDLASFGAGDATETIDVGETLSDAGADTFGDAGAESSEVAELITEDAVDGFESPVDDLADEFGGSGLFGDGPAAASAAESTSLQSVSDRIEALGSAAPAGAAGGLFGTGRRIVQDATEDHDENDGASDAPGEADGQEGQDDLTAEEEAVGSDSESDDFSELERIVDEVDHPTSEPAAIFGSEPAFYNPDDPVDEAANDSAIVPDPELDELFATMVTESRSRHQQLDWASKLDDVALGSVIASSLESGYALIDLHSLAQSHQARFEHRETQERLIIEIDSLGPASAGGALLGHHAYVTVGLGKGVSGDEMVDDDLAADQPGVIGVETDMESGYAYSTVDLIWEFDELLANDQTLDTDAVNRRVSATVHALRQHWEDRFGS